MSNRSWIRNIFKHKFYQSFLAGLPAIIGLILIFTFTSYSQSDSISNFNEEWVGTWSTAPQLVEPRNNPPAPGLSYNSLRQVVHVSIGGDSLRLRFSNEFSNSPVTMNAVNIAVSEDSSAVDPNTDQTLKFNGKPEVTIKPGATIISDPFSFKLKPLSNVTITIYFGDTSPDVTGHPGSRTTSYILPGDKASATEFKGSIKTEHWYIIRGIDVLAPKSAAAVAVLGNSITDGRGSGTNKQNRWPDELANRLQENPGTKEVAVLNEGIGGNCVLHACLGPSALSRFERDVIGQSKIRWLIILEGINDIGQVHTAEAAKTVANNLIAAYEMMIDSAHVNGIKVYGATMLPFGGSFYDNPNSEEAWKTVNNWIRSSGRFDAVIDLDAALHDPSNPLHLLPDADSGDHLHPSEKGHLMMAEAVDLALFK
ncbi:MAG: SGNH/GDSL hydrolase family protein [Ignavibacteriaceae bacterium]